MIRINSDKFETDLNSKPTDYHQFLQFDLAHPIHIKKPIVYSQELWFKRLCLSSLAFEEHLESIRYCFGKRDYPKKLVDNQFRRTVESRLEQISEHQTKHGPGAPLMDTYYPRFYDLGRIITKNFIYLYAKEQVKQVFTPAPFVSFQSGFSQRDKFIPIPYCRYMSEVLKN